MVKGAWVLRSNDGVYFSGTQWSMIEGEKMGIDLMAPVQYYPPISRSRWGGSRNINSAADDFEVQRHQPSIPEANTNILRCEGNLWASTKRV